MTLHELLLYLLFINVSLTINCENYEYFQRYGQFNIFKEHDKIYRIECFPPKILSFECVEVDNRWFYLYCDTNKIYDYGKEYKIEDLACYICFIITWD